MVIAELPRGISSVIYARANTTRGATLASVTPRRYRSSTARSLTGAITSIRSRSLTRSAGPST